MLILDIELTISRSEKSSTASASLRVPLDSRWSDLAQNVPIKLDERMLLAVSTIPNAYGAALTDMVFQPSLREAWQRVRGFAEGKGNSMRIRLILQGDEGLHTIRWELLCDPLDQTPLAYSERVRFSRFLVLSQAGS